MLLLLLPSIDIKVSASDNLTLAASRLASLAGKPVPTWPMFVGTVCGAVEDSCRLQGFSTEITLDAELLGPVFRSVQSRLNGEHSIYDLKVWVESVCSPAVFEILIKILVANGLVIDAGPPEAGDCRSWHRLLSQDFGAHSLPSKILQGRRIIIVSNEYLEDDRWLYSFRHLGAQVNLAKCADHSFDLDEKPDLILTLDVGDSWFAFWLGEKLMRSTKKPMLSARLESSVWTLGPTFYFRQTACPHCYVRRRSSCCSDPRGMLDWIMTSKESQYRSSPLMRESMGYRLVVESLQVLLGLVPATPAFFYEGRGSGVEVDKHYVLRIPGCPNCDTI